MSWVDECFGAERVRAVFGADEPHASGWSLVRLSVERNEVRAVVDLNQYPSKAPRKWDARGADTVHATLILDTIGRLEIDGRVQPGDLVALDQRPLDLGKRLALAGEDFALVAERSSGVSVVKVEGVRRSEVTATTEPPHEPAVPGAWLSGVTGGAEVVEAFVPEPAPDQPGALRRLVVEPPASRVVLTYNLDAYPSSPPPTWHPDSNTVTVDVWFDDVVRVSGHVNAGMPWAMTATTRWSGSPDQVEATVQGDDVQLEIASATATVAKVSTYQQSGSGP